MSKSKSTASVVESKSLPDEPAEVKKARNILVQADLYRRNFQKARHEFLARASEAPDEAIAWCGESMTIAAVQQAQVAGHGLLLSETEMSAIWSNEPVFLVSPFEVIARASKMVRYLARQLMTRSVGRASSTGHFHNAVDGATAEAYARIVSDLAGSCDVKDVA